MSKLEKVTVTRQDWINALRMPTPIRNKKKYTRKSKHKNEKLF